jgi:hypothetical protein
MIRKPCPSYDTVRLILLKKKMKLPMNCGSPIMKLPIDVPIDVEEFAGRIAQMLGQDGRRR